MTSIKYKDYIEPESTQTVSMDAEPMYYRPTKEQLNKIVPRIKKSSLFMRFYNYIINKLWK